MPRATLNWVLYLFWMLNFLVLFGAEAFTGRRPGRREPSRWYSRLLSAAWCLAALVLIGYTAWRGPWAWMDGPVMTLLLACFTLASFWPSFTLLQRRLRHGRNDGRSIEAT